MIVACDGAPNCINHAIGVYDVVEKDQQDDQGSGG
jgi:hypothetical protein